MPNMRLQRDAAKRRAPEACRSARPGEDCDRDVLGDGQQRILEYERLNTLSDLR